MYILWAIIGIVFLYFEFKKSNIFKLTFASSFLFASIISYKNPLEPLHALYGFIFFSIANYFLIKAIFKKEKNDIQKNKNLKDYVGKIAIVKKDIGKTLSIDGLGFIEFENNLWSAKSINDKLIKAGQKVEIVSKENMIMNVKAVK